MRSPCSRRPTLSTRPAFRETACRIAISHSGAPIPRFVRAFALLCVLSTPAFALDCKTASDQVSLNQCVGQDFKAADADLNAVYGQVAGRLSDAPDVKSLLTAAQRSWVAFRDAECAFRSSGSEGGSIHPMVVLGCRTTLTRKRVADLKAYLSCSPKTATARRRPPTEVAVPIA